jgi:hypothetical protein
MGWACCTYGDRRDVYMVLVGRFEEKRPLGRHRCDRRIILRWIFKTLGGEAWIGLIWLRIWTDVGRL